jgi:hypothetical protein
MNLAPSLSATRAGEQRRGEGDTLIVVRRSIWLAVPPLVRIVPDGVFDAFGWCASDRLEWGRDGDRAFDATRPITPANPPSMVFVMRAECTFLPQEPAALHVSGLDLGDAMALAPWAIDDATDRLWETGTRPGDLLWLATAGLDGLFWGLHDWAHFHNHGPFERRAWTELQCDAAALAWLRIGQEAIGIDDATWERARREVVAIAAARFADEGEPFDEAWLAPARIAALGGWEQARRRP